MYWFKKFWEQCTKNDGHRRTTKERWLKSLQSEMFLLTASTMKALEAFRQLTSILHQLTPNPIWVVAKNSETERG